VTTPSPPLPGELTLARLLAPLPLDSFIQNYWEVRPYFLSRNAPGFFSSLFSSRDLDVVLSVQGIGESLRLVKADRSQLSRKELEPGPVPSPYELYLAYAQGYTIIVNSIDLRWPAITTLCGLLQDTLDHPVNANLYATPGNAQGFPPHYDDHDVFILQIEGMKTWSLYDSPSVLPLALAQDQPELNLKGHTPVAEYCLRAGDMLYIPRGIVHEAATLECSSIHLTVMVQVFTWLDLLGLTLKRHAEQDLEFRRALPVGFARNQDGDIAASAQRLLSHLELADLSPVVDEFRRILRANTRPVPDGHFVSLDLMDEIGLNTRVRRRPGSTPVVSRSGGGVCIEFGGNGVTWPLVMEPSLRYIASSEGEGFAVRDLPGDLAASARIMLVQRLVVAGLLTVIPQHSE
jgi:ribosomal protein L16 Arg81 hydroxylase